MTQGQINSKSLLVEPTHGHLKNNPGNTKIWEDLRATCLQRNSLGVCTLWYSCLLAPQWAAPNGRAKGGNFYHEKAAMT